MAYAGQRTGISLIEVLFSIGVVAIGLAGIIAIFPVALNQAVRGNVMDRAAALGLNAEQEFYSRGMRNPANWLVPTRPPASAAFVHEGTSPLLPSGLLTPGQSFCIDPRFVAANLMVGLPNNPPFHPDIFPYVTTTVPSAEPRMLRVSLRGRLSRTVGINSIFEITRKPWADNVFVLDDELSFDIPEEKTLPPAQQYGPGAQRISEGQFSWFATVVPIFDPNSSAHDQYYLSIVLFHRRDPRLAMFQDVNADAALDAGDLPNFNESVAVIPEVGFHSGGLRGGDVTIQATSLESLELRTGNWVLLSRRLPLAGPAVTPPNAQGYFRWYRVVGADSEAREVGASLYEREVTLEGPDWPVNAALNPLPALTQAILVKNVVNVFERTIRLGP